MQASTQPDLLANYEADFIPYKVTFERVRNGSSTLSKLCITLVALCLIKLVSVFNSTRS